MSDLHNLERKDSEEILKLASFLLRKSTSTKGRMFDYIISSKEPKGFFHRGVKLTSGQTLEQSIKETLQRFRASGYKLITPQSLVKLEPFLPSFVKEAGNPPEGKVIVTSASTDDSLKILVLIIGYLFEYDSAVLLSPKPVTTDRILSGFANQDGSITDYEVSYKPELLVELRNAFLFTQLYSLFGLNQLTHLNTQVLHTNYKITHGVNNDYGRKDIKVPSLWQELTDRSQNPFGFNPEIERLQADPFFEKLLLANRSPVKTSQEAVLSIEETDYEIRDIYCPRWS